MLRSKDLDTVAPDDFIASSENLQPQPESNIVPDSTSQKSSKKTTNSSKDCEYRKRVYDILGHNRSPFSAFLVRPHVFNFPEKEEQEEILLVLRQHWFVNVKWILTAIIMLFIPIIFKYLPITQYLPSNYQFVSIIFWYTIIFAYCYEKFLYWYFNVYIITDERVVDIDFSNLLNKRYSEAKISMIQDVTSNVKGMGQTLYNYGNVLIQTAAEIPEIVFDQVPDPDKIIKVLEQLRQEEELEAIEGRLR